MQLIRNFSIIAHIDHGKSTLADRLIQLCGGLADREMEEQVLDSMDLERERGITIKAQSVALRYKARDGQRYQLNLIDTPGHVDFSYEVSRSLAACEGALLVVDASQGVEAQSVANCYTAIEQGLEVVPVLNKIDLPSADPDRVIKEIEDIIGIDASDAVRVSAKTGENVRRSARSSWCSAIPPPKGDPDGAAAGADHRFVVRQLRRRGLAGARGERLAARRREDPRDGRPAAAHQSTSWAASRPSRVPTAEAAGRRSGLRHRRHQGDRRRAGRRHHHHATPRRLRRAAARLQASPAAGVRRPVPGEHRTTTRPSATRWPSCKLNDSSLHYEPEVSHALGFGFRCGFLGLLHMDIVQERLEREYDLELITTAPTVVYEVLDAPTAR